MPQPTGTVTLALSGDNFAAIGAQPINAVIGTVRCILLNSTATCLLLPDSPFAMIYGNKTFYEQSSLGSMLAANSAAMFLTTCMTFCSREINHLLTNRAFIASQRPLHVAGMSISNSQVMS